MNKQTKENILTNFEFYLDEKDLSANEFADLSGVPANYLSLMRAGKYTVPAGGGKEVEIGEKYFLKIADTIGFAVKKAYWKTIITPQMKQILATLEDAKEFGYTNIIIGETGCGKTWISDLFVAQDPRASFKVTVGSTDTINDLLDKICEVLKLPLNHSKSKKITSIIKALKTKRENGLKPALILDEAEYMKQATLCNTKELHDHLNKHCALVLIGTDQLEAKLDKLRKKNRDGVPQFYRRIKFGIRRLINIDTSFKDFLTELDVQDKDLVKFLQQNCENYGELHDVLVPAMREADRLQEPLTLNLVRRALNIATV
ncbi:ATP-binding protein [Chryseobacterium herbae]|uniref:ATP-binding protein n=1 Tax=Chryseobacterium herbae TaxID=2976476 RepID=A0ABT2IYQ5_9FLAO|nr:ATP-binding protein [Chryseobacterium sp. pc1-10]MCT2563976.1 ATP-binding protein [Chryseobacterium sp. pc1-10]